MELHIGGYTREVRQRENGLEAVQITWPSGARTKKHDHGSSKGRVYVLKGRVFEVRDGTKTYYQAGEEFLEITVGSAHIVGNDSGEDAVTFHVFTPELEMTYFQDDPSDSAALAS